MSEALKQNNIENVENSEELSELRDELSKIDPSFDVVESVDWFKLEKDWLTFDVWLSKENVVPLAKITDWIMDFYEAEHSWSGNEFFAAENYPLPGMTTNEHFDVSIDRNWGIFSRFLPWSTTVLTQETLMEQVWINSEEMSRLENMWTMSREELAEQYANFLNHSLQVRWVINNSKKEEDELEKDINK